MVEHDARAEKIIVNTYEMWQLRIQHDTEPLFSQSKLSLLQNARSFLPLPLPHLCHYLHLQNTNTF